MCRTANTIRTIDNVHSISLWHSFILRFLVFMMLVRGCQSAYIMFNLHIYHQYTDLHTHIPIMGFRWKQDSKVKKEEAFEI